MTETTTTHKTFCRFCHACCALEVDVDDGRVVKVRGDRDNSMFRGYTCIKGRELPAQHNHPDRLQASVRRKGDDFESIPTEQALDEIADKLAGVSRTRGQRLLTHHVQTALQCCQSVFMVHSVRRVHHDPRGQPGSRRDRRGG